jgi:hypothetical protein
LPYLKNDSEERFGSPVGTPWQLTPVGAGVYAKGALTLKRTHLWAGNVPSRAGWIHWITPRQKRIIAAASDFAYKVYEEHHA